MKRFLTMAFLAMTGTTILNMTASAQTPAAPAAAPAPQMVLTSTSFPDGGVIPDKYTVKGAAPGSFALSWERRGSRYFS